MRTDYTFTKTLNNVLQHCCSRPGVPWVLLYTWYTPELLLYTWCTVLDSGMLRVLFFYTQYAEGVVLQLVC